MTITSAAATYTTSTYGNNGSLQDHADADTKHVLAPACRVDELQWIRDKKIAKLQPKPGATCTWRRFSRIEALALMDGHHLLFAGDSVSIYQYIALAMFLHSGITSSHDLEESGAGGDWNNYYTRTMNRFGGDEFCDCNRDFCYPRCVPQTFVGNRYFRFGHNGRISVIPCIADIVLPRGHSFDLDKWKFNCTRPPCNASADWEARSGCYLDVLKSLVDSHKPDILVQGIDNHWLGHLESWFIKWVGRAPNRTKVMCGMDFLQFGVAVTKQFGGPNGKPLVLTRSNNANQATLTSVQAQHPSTVSPTEGGPDVLVYDVGYITKKLVEPPLVLPAGTRIMKDAFHPAPWVYFELNMLLLNLIKQHIVRSGAAEQPAR